MQDVRKKGYRCPLNCFVLHGLYGYVIGSKRGFFTNDPQSHPYSIGVPTGHPSIKSFLGVPLIEEGKDVGLLAVANREGGYSYEQLEDLNAITQAVIQAIKRNKAEKALNDGCIRTDRVKG